MKKEIIRQKKGNIRPDISVWKNNKVVAIVECKTQLGWNRDKWEEDFKKRVPKRKGVLGSNVFKKLAWVS